MLLVSLSILPPWCKLIAILVSMNVIIYNAKKLYMEFKKIRLMKNIFKFTRMVWNLGGIKQTYYKHKEYQYMEA